MHLELYSFYTKQNTLNFRFLNFDMMTANVTRLGAIVYVI